ncbi:MAG: ABC transporter ATP-binding protein [Gemmatimonadaceae bacterium]
MTDDLALEVQHLTGPTGAPVLFDVSMSVPYGRTCVVLGPIHSGKTVLLRHIVGLEAGSSGTIVVDGEDFDARGESEVVLRRMRTRLGVVFQGSALINRLTVLENVELPLLEHTSATAQEAREVARELLSAVGLQAAGAAIEETSCAHLDRAAQRRVALARALALRPAVLLLDEPTLGLDSHSAAELDHTLERLQDTSGFSVVIFSHEVRHAFGRVDRIFVMVKGTMIESGTRETLQKSQHDMVRRLLNRRGAA